MTSENYKNGLVDAQYALSLDSDFVKGYLQEGKCHLALGSPDAALKSYKKALAMQPQNKQAQKESSVASQVQEYLTEAEANFKMKDYKKATLYLDGYIGQCLTALKLRVQISEASALMGRYKEVKTLAKAQRQADVMMEKGNTFFQDQDYTAAIGSYSAAIKKCPNCSAYVNRAAAYIMSLEYKNGLADARYALFLDSEFVKAYLQEGKCHLALGCPDAAVKSYQDALKRESHSGIAEKESSVATQVQKHLAEAEANFKKKDYKKAIHNLDSYIEKCLKEIKVKVRMAEAPGLLGRYQEVNSLAKLQNRADVKREQGNSLFRDENYTAAISSYTEAINILPNCISYNNRASAYMRLQKYREALTDAHQATLLDANFVKGYLQKGRCQMALGNPGAALLSFRHVLDIEPGNKTAEQESSTASEVKEHIAAVETNIEKRDFEKAIFHINRCIEHCWAALDFKIQKAETLALMGQYKDALDLVSNILQKDEKNADALYVKGICLYYQDKAKEAMQHFRDVLKRAPDHCKTKGIIRKSKALEEKKEKGDQAFKDKKYKEAYDLYSEALKEDPNHKIINCKLFFNRATVCSKLGKVEEAIYDFTSALELDDAYLKAYMGRAKCYTKAEIYDEAVKDYEKIYKMSTTEENEELLNKARRNMKKERDHYKVLGVPKTASEDEIKQAYKKRCLLHHPDRHSTSPKAKQMYEERKFKEIGQAFQILSDVKARARYDRQRR